MRASAVGRLTALWALAEVGLGGALHALRLPVTGLVVGSAAVVLLALLAEGARREHRPVGRALGAATAVVLGVKLAASPHSPVGAYLAVAFQGGLAALVLPRLGRRAGPVVLGVVALAESAVQRVLVLTLLFGAAFWEAVDALVDQVLGLLGGLGVASGVASGVGSGVSASLWLVGAYVGVHLAVGAFVGALAARLPRAAFDAAGGAEAAALARAAQAHVEERVARAARTPRRWTARPAVRRLGLAAVLLAVYGLTGPGGGGGTAALTSLVRAGALVALWATVAAPLALRLVRRVARRSGPAEAARAAAQLPELAALARLAWQRTAGSGRRRPARFALLVAASALAGAETAAPASGSDASGSDASGSDL